MSLPIEIKSDDVYVPIRFFLTDKAMPDEQVVAQLRYLAKAEGIVSHVSVLPDIHLKARNVSPTGTAVATKKTLLPRAVDTGINCGIRMIRTGIDVSEFDPPILDALFYEIQKTVPVLFHEDDVLSKDEIPELLFQGSEWVIKRFNLDSSELDYIEDRGMFATEAQTIEDILACMPRKSLKKGRKCFGTLGDGNHFLELQEIVEILDGETAAMWGLEKGQAIFMLHTGSRSVGSKMMKHYLKVWEPEFLPRQSGDTPIWAIPEHSDEGRQYTMALAAASNFGFANRMAITEQIRLAVRNVFHDQNLQLPLLYDCGHVSIKKEDWQGEQVWIHRHGASRALPAAYMKNHPLFAKTGQPLPIPGSMGHDSYIGAADIMCEQAFFSVNHGAGRVMDKPEASQAFSELDVENELKKKRIRLYRYGSDNIAEQAPGSFKNISEIIQIMQDLRLARPVVRLRPVAVLKG